MKQIKGQMSLFDFMPKPAPVDGWALPCDTCGYDVNGCCNYDYHQGDYCRLGDKWKPKEEKVVCQFSGHTCNKENLWEVADTLDELLCPHVCCRKCASRNCGARCNGSEEPKKTVAMFGKEWLPISEKPKDITKYDRLEILGTYSIDNKEKWSCCQAYYEGPGIIALDVPVDIPRPEWKYWRLREKVHPVDIKGMLDDAYCPGCGASLDETKYKDSKTCPWCGLRIDWEPWHRMNDEEEEEDKCETK